MCDEKYDIDNETDFICVYDSMNVAIFDILLPKIDSVGVATKNIESENILDIENWNDCVKTSDWVNMNVCVGKNFSLNENKSDAENSLNFEKINEVGKEFEFINSLVFVNKSLKYLESENWDDSVKKQEFENFCDEESQNENENSFDLEKSNEFENWNEYENVSVSEKKFVWENWYVGEGVGVCMSSWKRVVYGTTPSLKPIVLEQLKSIHFPALHPYALSLKIYPSPMQYLFV